MRGTSGLRERPRDRRDGRAATLRRLKFLSPGVIPALGERVVVGREFTWAETMAAQPVAMISENLARELWGDARNAIGQEIREDLKGPWRTIVGVVGDVRDDLQAPAPAIAYYPLLMDNFEGRAVSARRNVSYVIRSERAGSPGLLADVERAVSAANASLPVANVRTLQEIYDGSLARTSFALVMLALAGSMALLIGLVGLYGAMSYLVAQRTREIGIRMALGARASRVAASFLLQGCALTVVGVALGLAIAVPATRVLGSLVAGASTVDVATYAVVSLLLLVTAAAASSVPALRASSVDPVRVLRAG